MSLIWKGMNWLVDVAVVRFLVACESDGVALVHCAPYIREWMGRERREGEGERRQLWSASP